MWHLHLTSFFFWVLAQVSSSNSMRRIQVPENYRGSFPWYLIKTDLAAGAWQDAELVGNEEGIFALDRESGFLYALRPLDREEKESYTITVTGRQEELTINIDVTDENDNMPAFNPDSLQGTISRGSRAGVSFMRVEATDADDPSTGNGDLRYKIIQSDDDNLFHINPKTGAVSLTERGATYLSQGSGSSFRLLVQAKDLGDSALGFVASAHVQIVAAENTWTPPDPVSIPENHKGEYPLLIAEVLWNSSDVHYEASGNFVGSLFTVDQSGNIYVTGELDRESQAEYQISISALNGEGTLHSDPIQLAVTVTDDNDNAPVFGQTVYHVEITEAAAKGSLLLEVKADDADDPSTPNAQIFYTMESQDPRLPTDRLFHIQGSTGMLTLMEGRLEAATANQYTLLVSAADLAGAQGGLSSTCTVLIDVIDINDRPPVFDMDQFPPFIIKEDAQRGEVIAVLMATDADEKTENREMEFSIQSGNEEENFSILPEEENSVTVVLVKALDYEHMREYSLVIAVKNRVELLGEEYGPSSTASLLITVEDVNELPDFKQKSYDIQLPENTPAGSVILTVEASDPDIYHQASLRYHILGDTQNWLSIQENSGKIQLLQSLDREEHGDTYSVQVIAQEAGDGGLSASVDVLIHILDVNDNIPNLIGDHGRQYLCTPKKEEQRIIIQACDRDSPENSAPFRFSLSRDAAQQSNWTVTTVNGTHAYLTMRSNYLEPGAYQVPITITDNGTQPQRKHAAITVTVCRCNQKGHCKLEVGRMEGMPTVASAVGIIVGTLVAIGVFVILIFAHMSFSRPRSRTTNLEAIPLKTTSQ